MSLSRIDTLLVFLKEFSQKVDFWKKKKKKKTADDKKHAKFPSRQRVNLASGPEFIKLFSCSTLPSTKFILLINVKMPTIVGILTFISMINTTSESLKARKFGILRLFSLMSSWNFVLSWVEHEKSFITSGTDWHEDWHYHSEEILATWLTVINCCFCFRHQQHSIAK